MENQDPPATSHRYIEAVLPYSLEMATMRLATVKNQAVKEELAPSVWRMEAYELFNADKVDDDIVELEIKSVIRKGKRAEDYRITGELQREGGRAIHPPDSERGPANPVYRLHGPRLRARRDRAGGDDAQRRGVPVPRDHHRRPPRHRGRRLVPGGTGPLPGWGRAVRGGVEADDGRASVRAGVQVGVRGNVTLRVDGVTRASAPALIRATARCIDDNDAAIRALHRKHGGDIRPDRAHRSGDVVVWYPVADGAGAIPTDELLAHVDAFGEVIRAFTDGAAVRQPDHEV